MEITQSAKIYADSLLKLSLDKNLIKTELSNILNIFSNELYDFLANPSIDLSVKYETIDEIFIGKISSELCEFIKVLTERKRICQLKEIYESYIEKFNEINQVMRVKITSAIYLDDELKGRITSKLAEKLDKTIDPEWIVSQDIIAGLVIQYGDNIIDTSLKYKLENLSKIIGA